MWTKISFFPWHPHLCHISAPITGFLCGLEQWYIPKFVANLGFFDETCKFFLDFFSFNPDFFAKIIKKPTFFSYFVFLDPVFSVCNRFFSRANIYLLLMEHKDTKTRMELGYDKQQKTHQCVTESFKPWVSQIFMCILLKY